LLLSLEFTFGHPRHFNAQLLGRFRHKKWGNRDLMRAFQLSLRVVALGPASNRIHSRWTPAGTAA
jgi:hypothetical protein